MAMLERLVPRETLIFFFLMDVLVFFQPILNVLDTYRTSRCLKALLVDELLLTSCPSLQNLVRLRKVRCKSVLLGSGCWFAYFRCTFHAWRWWSLRSSFCFRG